MVGLFLIVCIFYAAWMTGLRFVFVECKMFPNYNMLASAFVSGHLFIENTPPVDTVLKDGKRYIFSGPVPALLRMPLMMIGKGIPTGLMIVIFCAAVSTLFAMILEELIPSLEIRRFTLTKNLFVFMFIFNGVSLFMVTIPSIHHESICAAMFFLMLSIWLLLRAKNKGYQIRVGNSILLGMTLSLAIGSRSSYVFAAAVIGCVLAFGMLKNYGSIPKAQIIRSLTIIAGIAAVSAGLLLWYNYNRSGSFFDFGMKYLVSLYRDYFDKGGYFRYDHFPYNFWSLFFQLPEFIPVFPFLLLPRYILQVHSIGLMPYFLINSNELTVSIFFLMPILVLCFVPLFTKRFLCNGSLGKYVICSAVLVAQILSVGFTVATIARYYYDFLPLLMMMAFIGAVSLKMNRKISDMTLMFLGIVSILISWALPMNAIQFYAQFIDYPSPLLNVFF